MSENTTVPAVFVSCDCSLGYGRTGRAAPRDCGWSFYPDGEIGRCISCLEEELFFPARIPAPDSIDAREVQRAPEQPIFAMTNRKLLEKIHDMLAKLI